jgi:transcriptional regulator with XRE-family HTH domain
VACLETSHEPTFGQRLKAFRLASGLTRVEMARAARMFPSSVKAYEEDLNFPRPSRRAVLARALGLTVERLGTGRPVPGKRPPGRPRKQREP